MTQFSNATFSVGGRHCDGCSQRDVWLSQKDAVIRELENKIKQLEEPDLLTMEGVNDR